MRTSIVSHLAAVSLVGASFLAVQPVGALTIEAAAQGSVAGVPQQDVQGPAAAGSLLADVEYLTATNIAEDGNAIARGAQDDQGNSAVEADGAYGVAGDHRLSASTRWTQTAVNPHDRGIEYLYSFFIIPPRLALLDHTGVGAPAIVAEWSIEIFVNGNLLFESQATLEGGRHTHRLTTQGVSLSPRPFVEASGAIVGYQFGDYDNVLSLGFYPPGQGVTVETILTARTRVMGAGQGARAEIGDPLDLGSDPGILGGIIESEPVAVQSRSWSAVKSLYGR